MHALEAYSHVANKEVAPAGARCLDRKSQSFGAQCARQKGDGGRIQKMRIRGQRGGGEDIGLQRDSPAGTTGVFFRVVASFVAIFKTSSSL